MRRATTMLGALALAAAGFLFAAPTAHAQTPLDTISNGGVTCKQYSTAYDWQTAATDTFWDCIDTGSAPTSFEKLVPSEARDMSTPMKTTLADVEIMIFQDRTDFASFTGAAAPDAKYMAWTAPDGPAGTNLEGKRIAAVFAEAELWSTSDDQIGTRSLTAYYKVHIMQALGRQYDQLTGTPSAHQAPPAAVHIFPISVDVDKFWTNDEEVDDVWDSDVEADYPGNTPWEILGHLYGNSHADIYAFQFAKEFGSQWSHLHSFVNSYLNESEAYTEQQIFGHTPIRPVEGKYDGADGVMCVEYTTVYDAPADKIYDCLHPYNSQYAGERTSGQGVGALDQDLKDDLDNNNVKLYIMRDIDDWVVFHELAVVGDGLGVWGISSNSKRVSAAFYRAFLTTGANPLITTEPSQYYKTTLVHEVGHHLDNIWGNESAKDTFTEAVDDDLDLIDAEPCLDVFHQDVCNNPKSYTDTYAQIFAAFVNPDSETCTDILASNVCSSYTGTNTQIFNQIPDLEAKLCTEVFAGSVCNANRKDNRDIMSWKYSITPVEVWSYAFQSTAPTPEPAELEHAMDGFTNTRALMNTNPDIHSNGDPNWP